MPFFISLDNVESAIVQGRTFLEQTISDLESLTSQSPAATHCISIEEADPGIFDFAQKGLKARQALSDLSNWKSLPSNDSFRGLRKNKLPTSSANSDSPLR